MFPNQPVPADCVDHRADGLGPGDAPDRSSGGGEADEGPALTERERATHALNRMAFGPRPGQVERVMEMGVENWMRQQLDPGSIDNVTQSNTSPSTAPRS